METARPDAALPQAWSRAVTCLALALLVVGAAWRILRYLLRFPLWGDEAFVCLNFLDRDYLGLLEPLRFKQVVPVLFMWSELTAYRLLGGTELALRLLPVVAGLAAMALFWRLARSSVSPQAGLLAVGILAVAYYPVRHSCEVKPYAFDLLAAVALMLLAVEWQRRPGRLLPLALLTLLTPLALLASYPAVFVAGAVSAALLPTVCRRPGWRLRGLYAAYNVLVVAAFLSAYWLIGRRQFTVLDGTHNQYWAEAFPPVQPWLLVKWLLATHTGNMLAYPVGGKAGASAATFLLCVLGIWELARRRRWELLLLCLVPFGLTLAAAALHHYPYGGSARVAQHLAPAICLLAGTGAAALLLRARRSPRTVQRLTAACCALLAMVAVAGMARDLQKPYKTAGDFAARHIVAAVAGQSGVNDPVVVLDQPFNIGPTFEWYLRQLIGDRVAWDGQFDCNRLGAAAHQLWCLRFNAEAAAAAQLAAGVAQARPEFVLADHVQHTLQLGFTRDTIEHCEVFHWVFPAAPSSAHRPSAGRTSPASPPHP